MKNFTLITGASSGIGYEAAHAFAERGDHLILVARRLDKLEALQQELRSKYAVEVDIHTYDLADIAQCYALYEAVKDRSIKTWINNAGMGHVGAIETQDLQKVEQMMRLNVEAVTILSTLYARDYANTQGAQLINVSSGGGYLLVDQVVTYCATKFYVSAFTEGLAHELKAKGAALQAKVLAPATTQSEFLQHSLGVDAFSYEKNIPKYHTAKEMAHFLVQLYDSSQTVGFVNGATFEFELKAPIFPHASRPVNN
ncbi:short-chain dehydrogenase/reductase SDR [Fictibacillus macauensis ZFHKF-1]|uniref:Short-chain dehydrogenase/reductase SDR n=1 Tax=Fictibacillus macauensis ZFHKF-1 TaxID=1196324 RepID=I8UH55_9BACL|nr:SDR family NAD(P)-dependent oxidoreductase [Fictibacillus macauensis]EIT86143.1 short-chain dehydrogenase/reductase SDR [Fictibacillus macauensis ZFHKF-1]